ncbi:MAG: hypothetical protein SO410_00205, partial [Candidatus Enterosoma sp.]|nr:hypothetical protein [Candidatus Enterosoma sp.]
HWFGKANYTFFWKTPQYFDYSPLQFTISRKKIKRKTIKRDKEKAGPFSGWRGSPDCFENIRMKRCGSNEEYYANEYSAIRIMRLILSPKKESGSTIFRYHLIFPVLKRG